MNAAHLPLKNVVVLLVHYVVKKLGLRCAQALPRSNELLTILDRKARSVPGVKGVGFGHQFFERVLMCRFRIDSRSPRSLKTLVPGGCHFFSL